MHQPVEEPTGDMWLIATNHHLHANYHIVMLYMAKKEIQAQQSLDNSPKALKVPAWPEFRLQIPKLHTRCNLHSPIPSCLPRLLNHQSPASHFRCPLHSRAATSPVRATNQFAPQALQLAF